MDDQINALMELGLELNGYNGEPTKGGHRNILDKINISEIINYVDANQDRYTPYLGAIIINGLGSLLLIREKGIDGEIENLKLRLKMLESKIVGTTGPDVYIGPIIDMPIPEVDLDYFETEEPLVDTNVIKESNLPIMPSLDDTFLGGGMEPPTTPMVIPSLSTSQAVQLQSMISDVVTGYQPTGNITVEPTDMIIEEPTENVTEEPAATNIVMEDTPSTNGDDRHISLEPVEGSEIGTRMRKISWHRTSENYSLSLCLPKQFLPFMPRGELSRRGSEASALSVDEVAVPETPVPVPETPVAGDGTSVEDYATSVAIRKTADPVQHFEFDQGGEDHTYILQSRAERSAYIIEMLSGGHVPTLGQITLGRQTRLNIVRTLFCLSDLSYEGKIIFHLEGVMLKGISKR